MRMKGKEILRRLAQRKHSVHISASVIHGIHTESVYRVTGLSSGIKKSYQPCEGNIISLRLTRALEGQKANMNRRM